MKKIQNELIRYLAQENRPITSTELANTLGVSIRSIKNYISDINYSYNKKIIISSRQGYSLNRQIAYKLLLTDTEEIPLPQTGEERIAYIIKQLILEHTSQLNLFDLCEHLCIGYSTIKSLISKMNKTFSVYNIKFICKNDCLHIIGSEKDKRRLISYVINDESKSHFVDIQQLKHCFKNIDVDLLNTIVFSCFKKYNYYLNDFAAVKLLFHLLIIIERNLNGNELTFGETSIHTSNESEKNLLLALVEKIQNKFHILLNPYEQFEIFMLFKATANLSIPDSKEALLEYINKELLDLTDYYVLQINNHYLIDLSDDKFTTPFTLHLENLIHRGKMGYLVNNPLKDSIKYNNPIIFDIAIFIGLDIMERYNIYINEDEIAFLAIHIGSEIERQNANQSKIRTALLCPNYRDICSNLSNNLLLSFGNQLDIVTNVSCEDNLSSSNFSLLLTTIPLKKSYSCETIQLLPFNLSSQYDMIHDTILKIQSKHKNKILRKNFSSFFEDDLFFVNLDFDKPEDVIHHLCIALYQKEYIPLDYEENVLKRENAATTAFGNIAIPHSVDMNAVKTSIAVAVSKKGFQWKQNIVHIVFLLALNKADKQTFRELYESLISLFCEEESILLKIRNCDTFNDFKNIIYSYLSN